MSNTVSLTFKGQTITIQANLLEGYLQESFEHLDDIVKANEELKLIAEAIEEKGIPASLYLKYAKARHKQKTTEAKELGEVFGAIDNALAS